MTRPAIAQLPAGCSRKRRRRNGMNIIEAAAYIAAIAAVLALLERAGK